MNIDLAAQKSLDRFKREGFSALTDTEKTLATVWLFIAGVDNSGFSGYFSSKRGDLAFHGPTALRAIGATVMADLATEANAVFGPGGPPADREVRRKLLQALPESARHTLTELDRRYFACEEDADQLLEVFLARQKSSL